MKRNLILLAAFSLGLLAAPSAFAQATRTWISGVGDDANPCSRTAPCLTWAGAYSKTAIGGEMDALDPGAAGVLTITHAMMLAGGGGQVSTIINTGTNAITVNAGASDVVILRNLRLMGGGTGIDGVRVLSAGMGVLDNVEISGDASYGVELALANSAGCVVVVRNSNFTGGMAAMRLTSGAPSVTLDHVSMRA